MDTETIRQAVLRCPFRPFTLRMNDGREFVIRHPEYVAVAKRAVMVVDAATEAGVFLEPVLIASLHVQESAQSSEGSNP